MDLDFQKSAYDAQLFGFTAEQVSCERRHLLHLTLSSAIEKIFVKHKVIADPEVLAGLKEEITQSMEKACENKLNILENLDKKYFTIPENVLLPKDRAFAKEYTEEDLKQLENETNELKKEFLDKTVMLSSLKIENEKYEQIAGVIDEEIEVHKRVHDACNAINFTKLFNFVEKVESEE